MTNRRGGPNYRFFVAGRHVAASAELRIQLVKAVKELGGDTTADRLSLYNSFLPFFADFGNIGYGSGVTDNDKIEYIYSEVANGRIAWPIPSLLSWMSYYHPKAAEKFFRNSGLIGTHGIVYQDYSGHPGEWAAERRKKEPQPPEAEPEPARAYPVPVMGARKKVAGRKEKSAKSRSARDDILEDSARIAKNRVYLKELINVVTAIARDSGMSSQDLMEEIGHSMTERGLRSIKARSHLSGGPFASRWGSLGPRARTPKTDMRSRAFVVGAIRWLSSEHPTVLASYYQGKTLKYVTS